GLVLPDEEDDAALQVTGNAGKSTTTDQAGLKLAARRAYLAEAKAGKLPHRFTRAATSVSATFAGYPCGLSFFPVSETVTIVGGALGPVTWDEGNRRAQFTSIALHPLVGAGYLLRLAGHPKLPVIFVTGLNSNSIFRVEHVDGFLT